jgi:hypothetical protein
MERLRLGEAAAAGISLPVDLVGGEHQHPRVPLPARVEDRRGAEDVRPHEVERSVDAPVHVGLRGGMNDRVHAVDERTNGRGVSHVATDERESRVAVVVLQVRPAPTGGEPVEHGHAGVGIEHQQVHEMRTDEAGAARHDDRPRAGHLNSTSQLYGISLASHGMRNSSGEA